MKVVNFWNSYLLTICICVHCRGMHAVVYCRSHRTLPEWVLPSHFEGLEIQLRLSDKRPYTVNRVPHSTQSFRIEVSLESREIRRLCLFMGGAKDWIRARQVLFATVSHSLVHIFKSAHFLIFRVKHEKGYAICGLAWHPTYSRICYTDVEGNLGILENVCDLSGKLSSNKVMAA